MQRRYNRAYFLLAIVVVLGLTLLMVMGLAQTAQLIIANSEQTLRITKPI